MPELARQIARRVGETTVSGFGHSLGRDIYRHTGNIVGGLLIAAVLTGPLFAVFYAGQLFGMNYQTTDESRKRCSEATVILLGCVGILTVLLNQWSPLAEVAVFLAFLVPLFGWGYWNGYAKRDARQAEWEINAHNALFMQEQNIVENSDGTVRDNEGNFYRFNGRYGNTIELFAISRRNRRAYLELDPDGRLVSWSGLKKLA